ncbi:unannotated protein [freshwater metagenome]|uniref:Unannotated protein n=1 Tax=freshwater metagenome TaxID=449393 RepID=A0A6J6DSG8_9ZZZZ
MTLPIIAFAVPKASLPIRNTTVFPLRSTPVASAKTFGRPSNTKPMTPKGARHCSTFHPECCTVDSSASGAISTSLHIVNAVIMSSRILPESSKRVTDRPRTRASLTSL